MIEVAGESLALALVDPPPFAGRYRWPIGGVMDTVALEVDHVYILCFDNASSLPCGGENDPPEAGSAACTTGCSELEWIPDTWRPHSSVVNGFLMDNILNQTSATPPEYEVEVPMGRRGRRLARKMQMDQYKYHALKATASHRAIIVDAKKKAFRNVLVLESDSIPISDHFNTVGTNRSVVDVLRWAIGSSDHWDAMRLNHWFSPEACEDMTAQCLHECPQECRCQQGIFEAWPGYITNKAIWEHEMVCAITNYKQSAHAYEGGCPMHSAGAYVLSARAFNGFVRGQTIVDYGRFGLLNQLQVQVMFPLVAVQSDGKSLQEIASERKFRSMCFNSSKKPV